MKHEQFVKFFLNIKKTQLAELTIQSYERCLKKYLNQSEELNEMDIFKAQETMLSMSHLSKATQCRNLTILREYYNYAIKYKKVDYNAFCEVERPRQTKRDITEYAYKKNDLLKLFKIISKQTTFWQTFFILSLDTGARRGEITALQWQDINLQERKIIIKHSAYASHGIKIKDTKGKKDRIVNISPETAILLKKLLLEQKKNTLKKGVPMSEFVFITSKNKLLNPSTASHKWSRMLKQNNLVKHRLHDLRHTTATTLLDNNIDINTVKSRLGHANITTTMLYLHNNNDITAATIISEILRNAQL